MIKNIDPVSDGVLKNSAPDLEILKTKRSQHGNFALLVIVAIAIAVILGH